MCVLQSLTCSRVAFGVVLRLRFFPTGGHWGLSPPTSLTANLSPVDSCDTAQPAAPVFGTTPTLELVPTFGLGFAAPPPAHLRFACGFPALEPLLVAISSYCAWYGFYIGIVCFGTLGGFTYIALSAAASLRDREYAFRGVLCLWPCVLVQKQWPKHNRTKHDLRTCLWKGIERSWR